MKIFTTLLIALLCSFTIAQKREFEWYPSTPQTEIPDELKNENAIHIFKQVSFDYLNDRTTSITWIEKVKILNKEGLETYNKTYIPAAIYQHLETFSARLIKPDGSTKELKQSDIVVEGISTDRDDDFYNHAKYILKGAEIGDEIETIFIANYGDIFLGSDVSLGGSLYCLHSMVTITNYLDMGMEISKNGYDIQFQRKQNKSLGNVILWEDKNVPPEKNEIYSIRHSQTPYCSFAPNIQSLYNPSLKGQPFDWTDLAGTINSVYGGKRFNGKLIKHLKENTAWWATETQFTERLIKMLELINNIPYKQLEKEDYYDLVDYILNEKIDNEGRISFITAFLDHENVPFDIGFTRDKYDGPITIDMTNIFQLERIFFRVWLDNQELYIFPSLNKLGLYVNEIPYYYEGNNAFLVQREDSDNLQTIKFVELPYSELAFNKRSSRVLFTISENNSIQVTRKDKNSGAFSYRTRWDRSHLSDNGVLSELGYDTSSVQISLITDEILQPFYPVEMSLTSEFTLLNGLTPVDGDTLYAMELKNIALPMIFAVSDGERESDFYPLFNFTDHQSIYIQSESQIEALNHMEISKKIENNFGTFKFEITQVNQNVIKIDCNFSIRSEKLEASQYDNYVELIDAIEEIQAAKLVLTIK